MGQGGERWQEVGRQTPGSVLVTDLCPVPGTLLALQGCCVVVETSGSWAESHESGGVRGGRGVKGRECKNGQEEAVVEALEGDRQEPCTQWVQ